MTFIVRVFPLEYRTSNEVLMDLITSAAFFEERNLRIKEDENGFTFVFKGKESNIKKYFFYLINKYDIYAEHIPNKE